MNLLKPLPFQGWKFYLSPKEARPDISSYNPAGDFPSYPFFDQDIEREKNILLKSNFVPYPTYGDNWIECGKPAIVSFIINK